MNVHFFPFYSIDRSAHTLVECKPLLTGCPRGSGRWGDRRDPSKGQVVTSSARKCCSSWQGEASACHPSHTDTVSLNLLSENLAGRPACLAAAEPAPAQQDGCPGFAARWPEGQAALWYDMGQQVEFQPWNQLCGKERAMFFSAVCISQRVSVAVLAFPLPHHSVMKIKALRCISPVGFVVWCETLLLRDPVFNCQRGLWLCMSRVMICSVPSLPVLPCSDTWFCH